MTIGLDGFPWHTHGDLLVSTYEWDGIRGLDPRSAAQRFVADVTGNRAVIAIEKENGVVRDAWITEDPEMDLKHLPPERTLDFRYWDGKPWRDS